MRISPALTAIEAAKAQSRRLDAMASQAIEQNPLTPGEAAMFAMFERDRWPHDRRRGRTSPP